MKPIDPGIVTQYVRRSQPLPTQKVTWGGQVFTLHEVAIHHAILSALVNHM